MGDNGNAVINLTSDHEDADKVTIAFLVAAAALTAGKSVTMFLTKEAVRLGLPGYAAAIESAGSPPVTGGARRVACRADAGRRAGSEAGRAA